MNFKLFLKKKIPIEILIFKVKINAFINILYEFLFYYKFDLKFLVKDYLKNKNDLTKIKFASSRVFFNYFCKNLYQEQDLQINQYNKNIYYVSSDAIEKFIKKKLPKIKNNFILIIGNSDKSISTKVKNISNLLKNKYFKKMYSQNLTINNKKCVQLPIGIDLHTRFFFEKRGPNKILPLKFEEMFLKIIKKKVIKKFKIYCNFNFRLNKKRLDCINNIPKNLQIVQSLKISQEKTWENIKKYLFVACPDGNGYDTHRFWETLCLGSIPIVLEDHKLIKLYKNFPIITVKNWNELNIDTLNEKYKQIIQKKYNFKMLLMNYWLDLILKRKKNINKKISYNEFVALI